MPQIGKRIGQALMFGLFSLVPLKGLYAYDSLENAIRFYQCSKYNKALPIFINLAPKFKAKHELSNYALCQTKIADIIRNYGGTNIAIDLLEANERMIAVSLEVPSLIMAQNYLAKAEAYYSASNLANFKLTILKSIEIKEKAKMTDKFFAEDFLHLARYYKELPDRNDSCYYWINRSLTCAKSDKTFSLYTLPRIYNMLGYYFHPASEAYFANKIDSLNNNYRLSRAYYDSALSAALRQPVQDKLMLGKIYHNLGNSFNGSEMDKALGYYRRSIKIYEEFGNPSELAVKDWVIGRAFERLKLYDSAILQFQNGIMRLVPNFQPESLSDLPSLQPTLNDAWYTSLLVGKGNMFYQRYLENDNQIDLMIAYDHYVQLVKFNKYLVAKTINENEQIHWSYLFGSNAYQLLVRTGYDLLIKTGNKQYIQDAYGLIASAKYAFLNKDIIKSETEVSIKQSVLKQERKLVINNILGSISQLSESKLVSVLPATANDANGEFSLSQIIMANQFMDTVTFNKLSNVLHKEEAALIDFYFYGQDLYTIVISDNGFDVQKSVFPTRRNSEIIKLNENQLQLSPVEYSVLSNKIYRSTLESALMLIPNGMKRLIISPDGILKEIGWDALVVDTTTNRSFKTLNYLINKYTIRTVFTPVQLTRSSEKLKNGFFGIVPDFTNSQRFSAIPFSSTLVSIKTKDYNGIFAQTIPNTPIEANILHIASHVTTDPIHPYNSAIHFGAMDSLTIADLANAKMNANLVVLNGCQTGNGKYIQSEGTISIARAFYMLGAISVVTTQWSVDDKATSDVLKLFYENIEDGKELDFALREAKLDYISKTGSDESANPFYWAGLQLTGSSKSVIESNRTLIFFGLGLFLLISIVLFRLWKLRQTDEYVKLD